MAAMYDDYGNYLGDDGLDERDDEAYGGLTADTYDMGVYTDPDTGEKINFSELFNPLGGNTNFGKGLDLAKGLLSGKSAYGSIGQALGIAGLSALFNKITGGGLGQSGQGVYKGYQGGIPNYNAHRTQYALPVVPQTAANQAKVTDQGIKNVFGQKGFTDDRMARSMYQYGLTPERVAEIMGQPVKQIQDRYRNALGPNQSLLGGMYGPYNQTTHPARGDNTGARGMDYEYRRPGSGGITYFSPMQYDKIVPPPAAAAPAPAAAAPAPAPAPAAAGGLMRYASGGIADLGDYSDGGRLLRGPGDGVSDSIPATIAGKQPARLADGEFVIPARIVSEIGNGSTEAGAKKLYAMMDRVQNVRKKSFKNVAANTKADKYLPR